MHMQALRRQGKVVKVRGTDSSRSTGIKSGAQAASSKSGKVKDFDEYAPTDTGLDLGLGFGSSSPSTSIGTSAPARGSSTNAPTQAGRKAQAGSSTHSSQSTHRSSRGAAARELEEREAAHNGEDEDDGLFQGVDEEDRGLLEDYVSGRGASGPSSSGSNTRSAASGKKGMCLSRCNTGRNASWLFHAPARSVFLASQLVWQRAARTPAYMHMLLSLCAHSTYTPLAAAQRLDSKTHTTCRYMHIIMCNVCCRQAL